jgi:hypothetical protein
VLQLAVVLQQVQFPERDTTLLKTRLDSVACIQGGMPYDYLDGHTPWNCPVAITCRERYLFEGL